MTMRIPAAPLLLAAFALGPELASAQHGPTDSPQHAGAAGAAVLVPDAKYVEVDLERRVVRFKDGAHTIWEAPAGTGTGLTLEEWQFDTPAGTYQVQHKTLSPVWYRPDWYYRERGLPLPAPEAPERQDPGSLGAAAVYIGDGLAIHGTHRPELVGQQVSHGCIRLTNEYALRLFHNVQVGIPVVITGRQTPIPTGRRVPPVGPERRPPARNPVGSGTTAELLERLDALLGADLERGWTETGSFLVERSVRGDAQAARGLLQNLGTTRDRLFEQEIATFAADAFARGARTVLLAMDGLPEDHRAFVAATLVNALMDQYHGDLTRAVPWPTSYMSDDLQGPGASALRAAVHTYADLNR